MAETLPMIDELSLIQMRELDPLCKGWALYSQGETKQCAEECRPIHVLL